MYKHTVGIEHLATGIEFEAAGNLSFFQGDSPTIFDVYSLQPFTVVWTRIISATGAIEIIRLQAQYSVADMPTPDTTERIAEIAHESMMKLSR